MTALIPFMAPASALLAPVEALLRGFEYATESAVSPVLAQPLASTAVTGAQARQGFSVGSLHLMIPYIAGSELVELPQVYRLPNAPRWVLGMCNLHGALVPVFDPAHWFRVERPAPPKPMLLVLGHGPDAAGVVIDGLPQRLRFGPDEVVDNAIVPDALASCVLRAALIGGQIWFDLDSNALLAEFERTLRAPQ